MTGRRRHLLRSTALSLLVGLAMLASLAGSVLDVGVAPVRAQDDQVDDNEGGNNVEGNTYTSPDFGYAISWDRTWEATDDSVSSDPTLVNSLTLESNASIIVLEGVATDEPLAYVEDSIASLESDTAASNIEPIEDDLTAEVPSSAISFDYQFEDGSEGSLAYYVQAQSILDGEAILAVTHITAPAAYEAQIGEREDLLEGLSLDGSLEEVETDEPDPERDPDDDTASGDEAGSPDLNQASVAGGDGDRPANEQELVDLIDTSIIDINDFWARQYPLLAGGEEYTPPRQWVTWTGDVESACGVFDSFDERFNPGTGPVYCPPDQTIYYDLNFANYQLEVVPNGFVISAVMAHELGHHIQEIMGLEVCYETPCLDRSLLTSQEIEYMADCWAGAWAADAELRGRLGSGDIDATIVEYALVIGGSGFESADVGGHGRGSERIWWFLNGYVEGAARCLDTSSVTTGMLDETPASDETPAADETPVPDETPETPAGTTVGLEEAVELDGYEFEATRARTRDAIDTEEPDEGQFVLVYFHAEVGDDGAGPFDYGSWTLVDGGGTSYEVDENATNQLLSSAYEDGIDENLEAGGGYDLAMVFDVPADATGLTLVNAEAGLTVELGI